MDLAILRQHLVGSMGIEATLGDAALLRMLDNFQPMSELELSWVLLSEAWDRVLEAIAAPIEEIFRGLSEALSGFGGTLE